MRSEITMHCSLMVCSLLLVVAVVITAKLAWNNGTPGIEHEIVFPEAMDVVVFTDTKKVYDLKDLKSQINQETAVVYLNPKLTDYSIVSDFGFNVNDYTLRDDGTRYYKAKGKEEEKNLEIDQFGCFSYNTGIAETSFEMTLTERECMKIAKSYLEERGLFSNRLGTKWSTNETNSIIGGKTWTTGIGINFFADVEGSRSYGNARITVEINGNGEVLEVIYNLREYGEKKEVNLIPMEEAMKRLEKGKAFIEVESPSKTLVFEKVLLSYWSQERNPENLTIQPVYVFVGTSTTENGETESFSITVQAN